MGSLCLILRGLRIILSVFYGGEIKEELAMMFV